MKDKVNKAEQSSVSGSKDYLKAVKTAKAKTGDLSTTGVRSTGAPL